MTPERRARINKQREWSVGGLKRPPSRYELNLIIDELFEEIDRLNAVIDIARKNKPMVNTITGRNRLCLDCGGINGHTPECPSGRQQAAIAALDIARSTLDAARSTDS
jgi:hypothetical protein